MIYAVRHKTTYDYENEVTFTRCVLRLTPRSSDSQTLLESSISVTPRPSQQTHRVGPFGEATLRLLIETPHEALVIDAVSRVDVHTPPIGEPADSPAWETIRTRSFDTEALGPLSPATYLYPTRRTPILPQITEFGRLSFPPGRPIVEGAADLMRRIRQGFIYDSEATTVTTPAGEAFAARRGVCQDFANVMLSALRGLGLPGAYVSGYLRTVPPAGQPRLQGADATHAWVSVWCGEDRGWIGFDPTNDLLVHDDHITLAIGRDYADVAPIDGVMLASGDQTLKVEVDVIPEDEDPSVVRPSFGRVGAG